MTGHQDPLRRRYRGPAFHHDPGPDGLLEGPVVALRIHAAHDQAGRAGKGLVIGFPVFEHQLHRSTLLVEDLVVDDHGGAVQRAEFRLPLLVGAVVFVYLNRATDHLALRDYGQEVGQKPISEPQLFTVCSIAVEPFYGHLQRRPVDEIQGGIGLGQVDHAVPEIVEELHQVGFAQPRRN